MYVKQIEVEHGKTFKVKLRSLFLRQVKQKKNRKTTSIEREQVASSTLPSEKPVPWGNVLSHILTGIL